MAPLPPMYHFSWGKLTSVIHCDPLWRPQQKETSGCQQPRGELGSSPLALCPPSSDAVKAIGPLQGPKGFDLQTLAEDGKEEFREEMGRGRAPLRGLAVGESDRAQLQRLLGGGNLHPSCRAGQGDGNRPGGNVSGQGSWLPEELTPAEGRPGGPAPPGDRGGEEPTRC